MHVKPHVLTELKKWEESGVRTKQRRVSDLANKNRCIVLAKATEKRAKDSPGQKYLGDYVREALKDPSGVKLNLIESKCSKTITPRDALALKISADLSDDQYQMIRNAAEMHNADIIQTLHCLMVEKKMLST